jgi:phosphatidylserine/phosphatidylglycerophosphate/cardiolipin synthase-like enzyme
MNNSSLFNQDTFYEAFLKDLENARDIVIIESPFITKIRMVQLMPALRKLRLRGVRIVVNTKPLDEHNPLLYEQALWAIGEMQSIGVEVFMTVGHHRKLSIIDSYIFWEGSLISYLRMIVVS